MSILPSLTTGLGVEASAPPVGKGTILLVEDETTIITYLTVLLQREGWTVLCAQEGQKGIELMEGAKDKVSMAIVDGRLPDMSGEMVCSQLRTIDRDLPVLFCSGLLQGFELDSLGSRTRFLAKPFSPSQILSDIRGLLNDCSVAI
jgi:two-component system cell cycle sensor histidine kinase/response regulator CckA